jgi:phosphoglucose isomerase-like protein
MQWKPWTACYGPWLRSAWRAAPAAASQRRSLSGRLGRPFGTLTHHQLLVANCVAPSQALMHGRSNEEVTERLRAQNLSPKGIEALAPHKAFEGNRPSSTFLYKKMSPRVLGQLTAVGEHKVFVQGVVCNFNSFVQWVELANKLTPIVADASRSTADSDSSTSPRRAHMARVEQQYPPIFRASLIRPRRSGWLRAPRLPPLPPPPGRRP